MYDLRGTEAIEVERLKQGTLLGTEVGEHGPRVGLGTASRREEDRHFTDLGEPFDHARGADRDPRLGEFSPQKVEDHERQHAVSRRRRPSRSLPG